MIGLQIVEVVLEFIGQLWNSILIQPMVNSLVLLYSMASSNFGIAIVIFTIIIRAGMMPLTVKQSRQMKAMSALQPKLKEIQAKYKNDKDGRQKQSQETMKMYKDNGVNPIGCLGPMFIQMPIWIALYRTLWGSVELYQQPLVGWLTDLTMPDPLYVLPIAMGVTMAIQTAFQPAPEDQPQMKYIMWGMPIFLTVIMISLPAGLSLYMLTNNLLTIVQQYYIKRKYT